MVPFSFPCWKHKVFLRSSLRICEHTEGKSHEVVVFTRKMATRYCLLSKLFVIPSWEAGWQGLSLQGLVQGGQATSAFVCPFLGHFLEGLQSLIYITQFSSFWKTKRLIPFKCNHEGQGSFLVFCEDRILTTLSSWSEHIPLTSPLNIFSFPTLPRPWTLSFPPCPFKIPITPKNQWGLHTKIYEWAHTIMKPTKSQNTPSGSRVSRPK